MNKDHQGSMEIGLQAQGKYANRMGRNWRVLKEMDTGKGGPRASRARPLWALQRPALARPELMAGLLQVLFGCCDAVQLEPQIVDNLFSSEGPP